MQCETVKIMPSSQEQGEFVIINKADFDEKLHTLYEQSTSDETIAVEPKKRGRPAKD